MMAMTVKHVLVKEKRKRTEQECGIRSKIARVLSPCVTRIVDLNRAPKPTALSCPRDVINLNTEAGLTQLQRRGVTQVANGELLLLGETQQITLDKIIDVRAAVPKRAYHVVTGRPGTGKTFFIHALINTCRARRIPCAVLGMTNMCMREFEGGETVHTAFGFRTTRAEDLCKYMGMCMKHATISKTAKNNGLIIIDEAGMMSAEQFEAVVTILDGCKSHAHIVLVGDLNQIPPIGGHPLPYSTRFMEIENVHVLKDQYRTQKTDKYMEGFLESVLHHNLDAMLPCMKAHTRRLSPPPAIHLVFHRETAARINREYLEELAGMDSTMPVISYSSPSQSPYFVDESTTTLTKGMPVLFTTNKFKSGGVVNGTQGVVIGFDTEFGIYPVVRLTGTQTDVLVPPVWIQVDDEPRHVLHLPLVEARAITIHKSQGMTIAQTVHVDVNNGREFSPGLLYVALSRVRSLDLLQLSNVPNTIGGFKMAQRDSLVAHWCATHGI
tara:strand:+ start:4149 stop:5636 length:1488 start_codon:yes stop_codon:yes gene_type:complete